MQAGRNKEQIENAVADDGEKRFDYLHVARFDWKAGLTEMTVGAVAQQALETGGARRLRNELSLSACRSFRRTPLGGRGCCPT